MAVEDGSASTATDFYLPTANSMLAFLFLLLSHLYQPLTTFCSGIDLDDSFSARVLLPPSVSRRRYFRPPATLPLHVVDRFLSYEGCVRRKETQG